MRITAREIADAVQSRRLAAPDHIVPSGYSIDSRTLAPGECFTAIRGPNFDGHQFIPDALRQGASLIICSSESRFPVEPVWPVIFVDDTLAALQRLARHVRRKWNRIVIGITGSNGKTTTKEIMSVLLEARFHVFKSAGNFNNDYGLPLSILKLDETHHLAVLEMGMSHGGEIRRLCEVAKPDIGVVTNVRPVHLGNFKSLGGIAAAKRELIESLPASGIAVLNNDDPRVRKFGRSFQGKVITFGIETPASYRVAEIRFRDLDGNEFRLDYQQAGHLLGVPLIGDHNVQNCLPGIAVAHHLGLGFEAIGQRLRELKPVAGRGEVLRFREGFSVLNDTYNSNPSALEAVTRFLKRVSGHDRKILIAGEMLELGPKAQRFHRSCGRLAASLRIDWIAGVRGLAQFLCQAAREVGYPVDRTPFFEDSEAAGEWLTGHVRAGDLIAVKGSRGVKTEKVIEVLKRDHPLAET
jgi:UDP-N-acetylmuramoyl-tripeptide--D-alanyl-D-alanine ligase